MHDSIIVLVRRVPDGSNADGDPQYREERREVFAKVRSVSMREKYKALAVGLEPELVFVLADYMDYDGEQEIEFEKVRYSVTRTFRKETDELEITVAR